MIPYVKQLEGMVEGWLQKVPHLPKNVQKWLAENVWWMALVGAIVSGIAAIGVLATSSLLNTAVINYSYFVPGFAVWATINALFAIATDVVIGIVLALAVTPLRSLTKKGWTLLFIALLINTVIWVVGALLALIQGVTFSGTGFFAFTGFIFSLIFGAIFTAVAAYFLFEIRSQFAHVTKGAAKK